MRRILLIASLLVTVTIQAQTLYINNSNGTHYKFVADNETEVTFDETQQLIRVTTVSENAVIASQFQAGKVNNIARTAANDTELSHDEAPVIEFDESDKEAYNEITETIPTKETDSEYEEFQENFQAERVITITFSETGVKTNSLPKDITAQIDGGHIIINSARSNTAYKITGTCSNGSLKIYSTKKFRIMAQNVSLTNPNGPAINIQSGKRVYFTIVNNTVNNLCDGTTYNAPVKGSDGSEEDQKGTLFSEGQLIFDGNGTLNVTSLGGHAIASDDYIRIRSGNINILQAAKDGFRTKEKFIISRTEKFSPAIKINAASNGVECTEGTLTIDAGTIDITSGGEGIKVVYDEAQPDPAVIPDAYIRGGFIKIVTTGEKSSAIQTTRNYTQTGGIIQATVEGNGSKIINCDGAFTFDSGKLTGISNGSLATDEESGDLTSAGGIKCENICTVNGGTIAIECNGKGAKGINCNSDVEISGGDVTMLTPADNNTDNADVKKSRAITAYNLTVSGGKVVASAYDKAISVANFTISDGVVNAYSSDDEAMEGAVTQTGGWLLTKGIE